MVEFYKEDGDENTQESLFNRMGIGSALSEFYERGSLPSISGPDKIKDALFDIISTPYGTRFFLPTYGCRIHECLMEQNDFVSRDLAEKYVKQAIDDWEPRVTVLSVKAESDIFKMSVTVTYKINSLGMKDSYVYTMEKRIPELD